MGTQKSKSLPTIVWWLIIGTAFSRIGTSMTIPFISIFLHENIGLSLSHTGLVIGLSAFSYSIGGFWGGGLSDWFGRRCLLLGALLSYALIFIAFGTANKLISNIASLTIVFCTLNILSGISRVWYETLVQATLADILIPAHKLTGFSYRYIAINIGAAIGPLLGAALGFSGQTKGFYITGMILLLFFISFFYATKNYSEFIAKPLLTNKIRFSKILHILINDKTYRNFIIAGTIFAFGYIQQEAMLSQIIFSRLNSIKLFSFLWAINAIIAFSCQIPITKLLRNYSYLNIMVFGVIFTSLGLIGFGISNVHFTGYIISEVLFTLGEILNLSYAALVLDVLAPDLLRGSYFGGSSLQYLGRSIGPFVSGLLIQKVGITHTMISIAFVTLTSIIFYAIAIHRMQYISHKS